MALSIAFLGTGAFGVPTLRALREAGYDVRVAISQPDRPAGRGMRTRPTPIRAEAEALGIPHVQAADVNALAPHALAAGADLGVVVAFGQKLAAPLLAAFPLGCVNLHGSLLPRHRGAAPIQWAILRGDARTGVTVFQIDQRWDAGAVWSRREVAIGDRETADELHDRLARLGPQAVLEALRRIESGAQPPTPQDASLATRAPKLSRADGRLDFSLPAIDLMRRIHACWSWPAATCLFASSTGRTERLQVARAQAIVEADEERTAAPASGQAPPAGSFLDDLSVRTGRGRLMLLEVRPAGGRLMSFADFANGRRVRPPDRLLASEPESAT